MARGGRTHSVFLGGPGVRYEERPPHPALAPWVAVHWRIETDVDFELRIPPDGCMDVIGGDVIGSFSTFGVAHLPAGSVSAGIRFHPGGLPALLGLPATELVDLRVPIAEVAPRFRSLPRLAAEAPPPDPLARAVWTGSDLGTVARGFGYGERQLRRRVLAATGHSPKRLMRIARMQRLLLDGRGESWARSAVEHGYYDEAHMAHDVRDLAGATPHALLESPILPSELPPASVASSSSRKRTTEVSP
ncbi:MAG TPA: helix-turn-helix domain-containing protein [Gaiellales bacterium]|nr:helix-turn-helix domain-containing protein [Gaiellales bacterium]